MTEQISSKLKAQLQCPKCRQPLEMSIRTYRCRTGHVDLDVTSEGYPILKNLKGFSKQLFYGGKFPEGVLWEERVGRSEEIICVIAMEDEEDDFEPLQNYLRERGHKLFVLPLEDAKKLRLDNQALIILSHRVGRNEKIRILLKHPRQPLYIYKPGILLRSELPRILKQRLRSLFPNYFIAPLFSKRIESRYDQYLSDRAVAEKFARDYLPKEMHCGKGRSVLDIGCGRGRHLAMLRQLGYTVTGMDLQQHPYWARMPETTFLIGSAGCLPYIPKASFDLTLCMQVLMYISDDEEVLAQLRRVLKQGGYMLLQVTNEKNLHTKITKQPLMDDPYLQRYYSQSDLSDKLERKGFKIERLWTEKFYLPIFVSTGNILYEFILNEKLRTIWDRLVPPRRLGLINILARSV